MVAARLAFHSLPLSFVQLLIAFKIQMITFGKGDVEQYSSFSSVSVSLKKIKEFASRLLFASRLPFGWDLIRFLMFSTDLTRYVSMAPLLFCCRALYFTKFCGNVAQNVFLLKVCHFE